MKRKRAPLCRWECGNPTANRSRICDQCWSKRVEIRAESMAEKKLSQARRDTLAKARSVRPARMAIPSIELPASKRTAPDTA